MPRRYSPERFDPVLMLDAAGRRAARWANRHLERSPVRVPGVLLGAGAIMLAAAWGLGLVSGGGDSGADVGNEGLVLASIAYAVGGLCVLAGIAGLLSALVVHIVHRGERRP